ncbi:MAG: sulfatase-like hydrolase/transferase [Caldilineales bacterium]
MDGGIAEHADAQAGRLIDEIERLGYGENTLIFYIWGDNGSGRGSDRHHQELPGPKRHPFPIAQHMNALDALGGLDVLGSPLTDNMYHGAGHDRAARPTRV